MGPKSPDSTPAQVHRALAAFAVGIVLLAYGVSYVINHGIDRGLGRNSTMRDLNEAFYALVFGGYLALALTWWLLAEALRLAPNRRGRLVAGLASLGLLACVPGVVQATWLTQAGPLVELEPRGCAHLHSDLACDPTILWFEAGTLGARALEPLEKFELTGAERARWRAEPAVVIGSDLGSVDAEVRAVTVESWFGQPVAHTRRRYDCRVGSERGSRFFSHEVGDRWTWTEWSGSMVLVMFALPSMSSSKADVSLEITGREQIHGLDMRVATLETSEEQQQILLYPFDGATYMWSVERSEPLELVGPLGHEDKVTLSDRSVHELGPDVERCRVGLFGSTGYCSAQPSGAELLPGPRLFSHTESLPPLALVFGLIGDESTTLGASGSHNLQRPQVSVCGQQRPLNTTELDCPKGTTDEDLVHLSALMQLERLDLRESGTIRVTLERLGRFTQLHTLDLGHARVTDVDLQHFDELTQLKHLDLEGTKVSGDGLRHLDGLEQLRELDLEGTQVGDDGLWNVDELRGLQRLNLAHTGVTDRGLASLRHLGDLEELAVQGTRVSRRGIRQLRKTSPDCHVQR